MKMTKRLDRSNLQVSETLVDFIEKEVEVPIKIVSVGPDRKQTITK